MLHCSLCRSKAHRKLPLLFVFLHIHIIRIIHGESPAAPASTPLDEVAAGRQGSPLPAPSPEQPDCEHQILESLGWQSFYNSTGYSISTTLPSNLSLETWQSLRCLQSLTNLTLTGNIPNLPDTWASNGSFPVLQSINFSTAVLTSTLPSSWSSQAAFPQLRTLNFSATQLSGSLPESWAAPDALPMLTELYLHQTDITGNALRLACAAEYLVPTHATEMRDPHNAPICCTIGALSNLLASVYCIYT